jgi:hypothetical protein
MQKNEIIHKVQLIFPFFHSYKTPINKTTIINQTLLELNRDQVSIENGNMREISMSKIKNKTAIKKNW